ncbi:hypothetical protein PENTCL1PPCAC_16116, partial [Pristionchus entomophagus]
ESPSAAASSLLRSRHRSFRLLMRGSATQTDQFNIRVDHDSCMSDYARRVHLLGSAEARVSP